MKSKKIVALALTAAMAISMASMTAFAAATEFTIASEAAGQIATISTEADTGENETTTTNQEIVGFGYEVWKDDSSAKNYLTYFAFKKANGSNTSTSSNTTEDGKTTITVNKKFSDAEKKELEGAKYSFQFSKIKDSLPKYTADGVKHVGWTTAANNAAADDGGKDKPLPTGDLPAGAILKDDDSCGTTSASLGSASAFKLYPVWQQMTSEEIAAQRNAKKNVAIDPKTQNVYKEGEVKPVVSEMGFTEGESALEACKAKSVKSRIYDIKAYGQSVLYATDDDGNGVQVDMIDHQKLEVKLPIPREMRKDDLKNLKVYHINSKGQAEQLTITNKNWKADNAGVPTNEASFKFKAGSFSTFVVTWDPKAINTDSEGNPATGEASALPVALLAVAALSATGVVAYKKRKAE